MAEITVGLLQNRILQVAFEALALALDCWMLVSEFPRASTDGFSLIYRHVNQGVGVHVRYCYLAIGILTYP